MTDMTPIAPQSALQLQIEIDRLRRQHRDDVVRRKKAELDAERSRRAASDIIDRAEAHRIRALPHLADRLSAAVFTYAEQAEGRVLVRAQLAEALLGILMTSGLCRDPRRVDRPPE